MLQTPDNDNDLTLDRERMIGTAHKAMRRRRGVRLGVASAAALSVIGMGTATASALHSSPEKKADQQLPVQVPDVQVPDLPNALPKLPLPALPKPDLPKPDNPQVPGVGGLPSLPALPKLPVELTVGPQLDKAKKMLTALTGALQGGALPLPANLPELPGLPKLPDLPGLPKLPGLPDVGAPPVSTAQAFQYADGTFRYHAVSSGALAGFGGTVTLDVMSKKQALPTGDLCATKLVTQESGCEVVAGGDGMRVRLGWRTVNGAQTYFTTVFYPTGTATIELSPMGLAPVALPAPALAALTTLAAFRP